jgi:hypothetical protein
VLATFWAASEAIEGQLEQRALTRTLEDLALSVVPKLRKVAVKGSDRLAWRLGVVSVESLDTVAEPLLNGHFCQPKDADMVAIAEAALQRGGRAMEAARGWLRYYRRRQEHLKRIRAAAKERNPRRISDQVGGGFDAPGRLGRLRHQFDCEIRPARRGKEDMAAESAPFRAYVGAAWEDYP